MTTLMIAPSGTTGTVQGTSQSYTIGADGTIAADQKDVVALIRAGFTMADRQSNSANGIPVTRIPVMNGKNVDGTTLAASAASGKFGLAITAGTSENLAGEAAQNNTKTDSAMFEIPLPYNYVAGQNLTVTANAKIAGTGTPGTKTIDMNAYAKTDAGVEGADLIAGAAQNLTTSNADYAFVVDGTNLHPGDVLVVTVTTVLQETGNVATINTQINSVRIS